MIPTTKEGMGCTKSHTFICSSALKTLWMWMLSVGIFLLFSGCSANLEIPEYNATSLTKLEMNTLATWRSAMKLDKNGDLAVTVMEITSFMAPEKIDIRFFLNLVNYIPSVTQNNVVDAIRVLLQLSLLTQQDPGVLEVKPIIQQVVRSSVVNRDRIIIKAVQLARLVLPADRNIEEQARDLKHCYAISGHALLYDAVIKRFPDLAGGTAWKLIMAYQFKDGLELADRTLAKYVSLFGNNGRETLDVRRSVAWAYYMLGFFQEAMEILQDVYPKALKHLGLKDSLTLIAASDLASVFQAMGKYDMAIKLYNMLIPIYRNSENNLTDTLSTVLFNKGNCLSESGDHESALELYEETLKLQTERLGEKHEVVLKTEFRMASVLILSGQREKGQELLKNTHEAMKIVLGESHVLTKDAAHKLKVSANSMDGGKDDSKSVNEPKLKKVAKTEL